MGSASLVSRTILLYGTAVRFRMRSGGAAGFWHLAPASRVPPSCFGGRLLLLLCLCSLSKTRWWNLARDIHVALPLLYWACPRPLLASPRLSAVPLHSPSWCRCNIPLHLRGVGNMRGVAKATRLGVGVFMMARAALNRHFAAYHPLAGCRLPASPTWFSTSCLACLVQRQPPIQACHVAFVMGALLLPFSRSTRRGVKKHHAHCCRTRRCPAANGVAMPLLPRRGISAIINAFGVARASSVLGSLLSRLGKLSPPHVVATRACTMFDDGGICSGYHPAGHRAFGR